MMKFFEINNLRILTVIGIIVAISGFVVGLLCGKKINDEYEEYETTIQMEEL